MFYYPEHAKFNRIVPKSKIYHFVKPSTRVKKLFIEQVEKIVWAYKLAPKTVNIPAGRSINEIQVFNINLKTRNFSEEVLRTIDKAIMFPIFYELEFRKQIKFASIYKRSNNAAPDKWVLESCFESSWQQADIERLALPIATDLGLLYEMMFRQLMPLPQHRRESLKTQVERLSKLQIALKQAQKLEGRIQKEKQFNRKVELHGELKQLQQDIEKLREEKRG